MTRFAIGAKTNCSMEGEWTILDIFRELSTNDYVRTAFVFALPIFYEWSAKGRKKKLKHNSYVNDTFKLLKLFQTWSGKLDVLYWLNWRGSCTCAVKCANKYKVYVHYFRASMMSPISGCWAGPVTMRLCYVDVTMMSPIYFFSQTCFHFFLLYFFYFCLYLKYSKFI